MIEYRDYSACADYLRGQIGEFRPDILAILGSGLGFLGDAVRDAVMVEYAEIPGFRESTAPGHRGRFVFGELSGKKVAVMQGRMHYYEGYSPEEIAFPVRVANMLGCGKMIVTNACGAVNFGYDPGDIMIIRDHIMLFGVSPLRGPNIPEFGERFPDMSFTYSPALREIAKSAAEECAVTLREGVYMYFPGPQYETPAEIRAARALGADVCGMSTVIEAVAASQIKMEVLGFSLVCNMAAGILDEPLTEQEVLDCAAAQKERFSALILKCLERIQVTP